MTASPPVTLGALEPPSLNTRNWIRSPQIADSEARAHG
jgi:hypothetical protein